MIQTDGTPNPLARCKPKVAILRQEGTNGDREMISAFYSAGFEAWDVNMYDLQNGSMSLADFRGVVFCGGFSFADCHDSAKGCGRIRRDHIFIFFCFIIILTIITIIVSINRHHHHHSHMCQLFRVGWIHFIQ